MVDAQCSERCEATHEGSSPSSPTMKYVGLVLRYFVVCSRDLNSRKQFCNEPAETGPEANVVKTEGKSLLAHKFYKGFLVIMSLI